MNESERGELGAATRREVLGDAFASRAAVSRSAIEAEFRASMSRYAWGEVWQRPGLDRRTRSAVTIGALVALGHESELAVHIRGALNNGLTADEVREACVHCAVYCGGPAANRGLAIAEDVVAQVADEEDRG